MNHTPHAEERLWERCQDAGIDPAPLRRVADYLAVHCGYSQDFGLLLFQGEGQVNTAWGDRSNGNQVWAIVRQGRVRTVMLRRSTQPGTPTALRVDHVIDCRPKET